MEIRGPTRRCRGPAPPAADRHDVVRSEIAARSEIEKEATTSQVTNASTVEVVAKWITVVVALAGLFWGVVSTLETWSRESRRPFLDKQLALYEEATKAAAILATSDDSAELVEAEERFWRLYWGELAMVENGGLGAANGGVEGAMVRFGAALRGEPRDKQLLQQRSLELAHACRDSLAESWGVTGWKSPHYSENDGH